MTVGRPWFDGVLPPRPRSRIFWLLLLALPARAWAAPPAELRIVSANGCPTAASVSAALAPLLPNVRLIALDADSGAATDEKGVTGEVTTNDAVARIRIDDLGTRFRVALAYTDAPVSREFDDLGRDCDERTRTTAVFIEATLFPPSLGLPEPTPPPAPPPPPPPPPAPPPKTRSRVDARLEFAGLFDSAPRQSPNNSLYAGGGEIRALLGGKYLAASLGVTGLSTVTLNFPQVHAKITRIPLDLSLRARVRGRIVEFSGELGFAVNLVVSDASGGIIAHQQTTADFGLRLAAQLAFWVHPKIAPFIGIQTFISPQPESLELQPTGHIGNLPVCWIGANLGFSVRLH